MPSEPGVYQFFNKEDKIIYIGKAKNLKKRVSSYFQKNIGSRKTKNLVKNIHEIKHIVVSTESDALLLENSLIKKYQPKYNILLRDDKTYPWIVIKKESFKLSYNSVKSLAEFNCSNNSVRVLSYSVYDSQMANSEPLMSKGTPFDWEKININTVNSAYLNIACNE